MGRFVACVLACWLIVAAAAETFDHTRETTAPMPARGATLLRPALDSSVVEGCLACHQGALGLEDRPVEDLTVIIADMAAGRVNHPVPIPALSDEDVAALAEALAARAGQ